MMVELFNLHVDRFRRDRGEFERGLPPALLLFSPPMTLMTPASEEVEDEEYRFRTRSRVRVPMLGVGESIVFPILKQRENAFGRGITLGRTGNNDVVLDDATVSRFHAWFQRDAEGHYLLTDAGSKNGSYVAGRRLTPKSPVAISDGTRLRFGQVEVTFYLASGFAKMLARRHGL